MILDFPRLARDFGIPTRGAGHRHCHEGWIQVHCPFCTQGGDGWHLGWNLTSGVFNCWRCGRLKTTEVVRRLTNRHDIYQMIRDYQTDGQGLTKVHLPKPRAKSLVLPPDCGPLGRAHRRYLRQRGFNPDTLVGDWEIKGIGRGGGEWAWRILIPIQNTEGRWMTFQARSISDTVLPKYRNNPEERSLASQRELLYGEHLIMGSAIVIVEGPFDAWKIGPGAVSVQGAGWSITQAARMLEYERRFILFDSDRTGIQKAKSLAAWLAPYPGITEIITGFDGDPADFSVDQVQELRRELEL